MPSRLRANGGPTLRSPEPGGEAEAGRCPLEPGDDRTVHSDARNIRNVGKTPLGAGGELQLTDGMRQLLKREKIYAYNFEGKRHDTGDKLGFLKATVEFALKRDDLGGEFREYLKTLNCKSRVLD